MKRYSYLKHAHKVAQTCIIHDKIEMKIFIIIVKTNIKSNFNNENNDKTNENNTTVRVNNV